MEELEVDYAFVIFMKCYGEKEGGDCAAPGKSHKIMINGHVFEFPDHVGSGSIFSFLFPRFFNSHSTNNTVPGQFPAAMPAMAIGTHHAQPFDV